jgi:hypothetical protein
MKPTKVKTTPSLGRALHPRAGSDEAGRPWMLPAPERRRLAVSLGTPVADSPPFADASHQARLR